MSRKRFEATDVCIASAAGSLAMLVQPGYIILDLGPDDLDDPDQQDFMVVAEEPEAVELMDAIEAIGTDDCKFTPRRRAFSYGIADICVIEIEGPSAYVAAVVAAAEKLGLKNLRA